MPNLNPVSTLNAPNPNGHYSQAIQAGNMLFLSMQLPMKADQNVQASEMPVDMQVLQALKNVEAIIQAAGGRRSNVVRLTFYITDPSFWAAVNDACIAFFGEHKPARGILNVPALSRGFKVAVDAIACLEAT